MKSLLAKGSLVFASLTAAFGAGAQGRYNENHTCTLDNKGKPTLSIDGARFGSTFSESADGGRTITHNHIVDVGGRRDLGKIDVVLSSGVCIRQNAEGDMVFRIK